ncbi:MAG: transglycosylase SLT domain-containing protein, partial [Candidatus Melainabacteria bacterium]|nr:transglycosylase SLT domain-containing protein [Candidatus Melainabacteria bacterium]
QWHIVECATQLGQEKVVRLTLEEIRDHTSNHDTKAACEYGLAQSYLRANESSRAKGTFTFVRKQYPTTQYALGAAYYLGEMGLNVPADCAVGLTHFREYLRQSPDGHFARDILARLSQLADYTPNSSDHELFGQVHFVHGEWTAALDEWSKVGRLTNQESSHWDKEIICLAHLGRTKEAKEAFLSAISVNPGNALIPDAAQLLCRALSISESKELWLKVLGSCARYGDIARWNLALRCPPSDALKYYREITAKYPKSDFAPESSWFIFWSEIKQGHLTKALSYAQATLAKYPQSRAAARFSFWCGKLHEYLNHKDLAVKAYRITLTQFPSSYYAHRARCRIEALQGKGDTGWQTRPSRKHPNVNWSWPEPPALISWQHISQTCGATQETLARLCQIDECLQLLPKEAKPAVKSWLLAKLHLPLDAINAASNQLNGNPKNSGQWQLAYPLLYAAEIDSQTRTLNLDPLLVHALIREESRYNPLALSTSNALGLMQLLPSTAYGVAKKLGVTVSQEQDIYKPENNIKLGTEYLAYVLRCSQGNALMAVASYNGGPNAVWAWKSKFQRSGLHDLDVFVEDIPLAETRDYVRKVFGSFWNYQAIYGTTAG